MRRGGKAGRGNHVLAAGNVSHHRRGWSAAEPTVVCMALLETPQSINAHLVAIQVIAFRNQDSLRGELCESSK